MAIHLADRLTGADTPHLAGAEDWLPYEPAPAPAPEPDPQIAAAAPAEEPSAWLQQLPPLNLHPEIDHAVPEWGVPQGTSSLLDLPAPAVTAPAPAATPATAAPDQTAASAAVAAPVASATTAATAATATSAAATPPAATEPAVDASWLAARETALQALRDDYTAAHQQALSLHQDLAQSPDTQGFDATRFGEQFLADAVASGNAAWKTLADLYETDPATLVSRHPELLQLALTDHALNAGPPPPGRAMGSVQQLGITDLVLADPLMREIAQTFGQTPDAPRSSLAWEQVRLYGETRYEQMTRLHIGMEVVRDEYTAAMIRAADAADGPGWVNVPVPASTEPGSPTGTERRFDPDAFTRWYNAQDGLANRAFAQLYGNSHTERQAPASVRGNEPAASGPGPISRIRFDNAPWHMDGLGAPMRRDGLVGLDLNTAPRMHSDEAVGFDFEVGWATAPENIVDKPSTTRQVVQLAVVVAVSYFTWNPVNVWATTATGGAVAGAMVAGAAAAAAGSLASGVMNGNVELKDIVRSAFSAALTAGLMGGANELGLLSSGSRVAETAVRMTVQGSVQALMGGEFKDGAAMAFASGLAQAVGDELHTSIARSLPPDQVSAAQTAVRVITSAIRALGNPDDPLSAFASSLLQDVLQDSGLATTGPVANSSAGGAGGATAPAAAANAAVQAVAIAEELMGLGYEPDAAAAEAMRRISTSASSSNIVTNPTPGAGSGSGSVPAGHDGATVIEGVPPARDSFGNRYQPAPGGQTTVYLAQGGMLMLGASQTVSITDGLAVPSWQLLRQLGEVALRAPALAVGALLAGMPSNVDQGAQVWPLNANSRLQREPGELWATMYHQTPGGDWRPVLTEQTRPDGTQTLVVNRFWVESTSQGFFGLSEAELQRLRQPMTTPAGQPPGPVLITLPAADQRQIVVPPSQLGQAAGPTVETLPEEQMRLDDLIIESRGFARGTPEHREEAWRVYGERENAGWGYDRWLVTYEQNQTRALAAREAEISYQARIGWGVVQGTSLDVVIDGRTTSRRLDIVDELGQRGIEYKTGYQTASVDNLWELERDAELVARGWQIQWVFRDRASQPLLDALEAAGIQHKFDGP